MRKELPKVELGCLQRLDPNKCPEGYVIREVKASTVVDGKVYRASAEKFRPNSWAALMALGKKHVVEKYFASWDIEAQGPIRRMIQDKVQGTSPSVSTNGNSEAGFIFDEEDETIVAE